MISLVYPDCLNKALQKLKTKLSQYLEPPSCKECGKKL